MGLPLAWEQGQGRHFQLLGPSWGHQQEAACAVLHVPPTDVWRGWYRVMLIPLPGSVAPSQPSSLTQAWLAGRPDRRRPGQRRGGAPRGPSRAGGRAGGACAGCGCWTSQTSRKPGPLFSQVSGFWSWVRVLGLNS